MAGQKFEVKGDFRMGDEVRPFSKVIEAPSEMQARERIFTLFGSKHRVKEGISPSTRLPCTRVNDMDAVDPRELQSLQIYLNEYRQQAEVLSQQLALLEEGRVEAMSAIEAVRGIAEFSENTVLLQMGAGISVRARVQDPARVLVNIGSEVVVERSTDEAVEYLQNRITEMEASAKKVMETLDQIRIQMNEIGRRLEAGYRQYQMQQAQAQAVQGGELGG